MTGAHFQLCRRGDTPRSPVTALLWLLTALSVLQWSAPPVDPSLLKQPGAVARHEPGMTMVERLSPAIEAAAPASVIAFEKRSPGGRTLPSSDDLSTVTAGLPPADLAGRIALGTAAPEDGQSGLAGRTFTARGPPVAG